MSVFTDMANIQQDFNLFAEGAEIMENLSKCKFEGPAFDLLALCTKDPEACQMPKVLENLTKNMFVLVGKMTSLAETLQDFPQEEQSEYQEQMRELGDDFGTGLRVIFNYQTPKK